MAGELHDQVIDQTVRLVHFRAGSLSAYPLGRSTVTLSIEARVHRYVTSPMNVKFILRASIAFATILAGFAGGCVPALHQRSPIECAQVDSATAVRLATGVFAELDSSAAAFARARPVEAPRTVEEPFDVLWFERDQLGAWLDLSPGYALGGDAMFRVTGCGCAQVLRTHDDTTTAQISPGPSFPRWHFGFLPPDSTLAVELARDAMLDRDFATDSLETVPEFWHTATTTSIRKMKAKYISYDVIKFRPDPAGVTITLAPRRRGWGVGGEVRVTGVGCVAYRWTGV